MTPLAVTFSGTSLKHYADKVEAAGLQAQVEMQRGLNQAGDVVRTNVRRAVREQTSVLSPRLINTLVDSIPGRVGDLRYRIVTNGKGLPIRDFAVSASPGGPVTATVWGIPIQFQRSFMTSRRGLLMARRDTSRKSARFLFGANIAKEIVKGETLKTFERAVPAVVEPIVAARLTRLMP